MGRMFFPLRLFWRLLPMPTPQVFFSFECTPTMLLGFFSSILIFEKQDSYISVVSISKTALLFHFQNWKSILNNFLNILYHLAVCFLNYTILLSSQLSILKRLLYKPPLLARLNLTSQIKFKLVTAYFLTLDVIYKPNFSWRVPVFL